MKVTKLSGVHQTYRQLVKDSVGMIEFIASEVTAERVVGSVYSVYIHQCFELIL